MATSSSKPQVSSSESVCRLSVIQGGKPRTKAEQSFLHLFSDISEGFLVITFPLGEIVSIGNTKSPLRAHLLVKNPSFFDQVLGEGSVGLGESYMEGWWDVEGDRIADFIAIISTNKVDAKVKLSWKLALELALFRLRYSSSFLWTARSAIQSHYDLGNDFYQLFLDRSMTYSCGYQIAVDDSLEKMQEQKHELVAKKLGLGRGGTLLDIGCGWGAMLIYAAKNYPQIRGLGITLSQGQFELACKRIQAEGLSDRVEVRLCDYRQVEGSYDFVVSVGMFEHVGRACYPTFFRQVYGFLNDQGTGLLHTIASVEPPQTATDPWITKYIFPNGRLPRLEEICFEMRQAHLTVAHVENLKLHYAATLRHWKNNMDSNRERIRAIGPRFDEKFLRMWNYYLQCCEAGFRYGSLQVYQVLFSKGACWPFALTFGRVETSQGRG